MSWLWCSGQTDVPVTKCRRLKNILRHRTVDPCLVNETMSWVKSSRTLLHLPGTVEIPEPPPAAPRSCLQDSQFAHASLLMPVLPQAKLFLGQRASSELPLVLPAALKKGRIWEVWTSPIVRFGKFLLPALRQTK